MKFRRKPEPIDAIQYVEIRRTPRKYLDHIERNENELAEFVDAQRVQEITVPQDQSPDLVMLALKTAAGTSLTLHVGSWIVRDSAGNFDVCGPHEFAKLFEPI